MSLYYRITIITYLSILPIMLFGQYSDRRQKREKLRKPLICSTGDYQIIFQDDFTGDTLDTSIWRTSYGNPKPWDCTLPRKKCGTELQFYHPDNVKVSNGTLKITTRQQRHTYKGIYGEARPCAKKKIGDPFSLDFDYTSGMIETKTEKIAFQYGRFEVRCRLPKGAGYWPAFWLWGGGGETGRAGEIDILEIFDTSQPIFTTSVHNGSKKARVDVPITWEITDWHVYALEWDELTLNYYLDGQLIRSYPRFKNNPTIKNGILKAGRYKRNEAFPWQQWMVLRFNVALNPEKGQSINATTPFPAITEIDYIKVYKKVRNVAPRS